VRRVELHRSCDNDTREADLGAQRQPRIQALRKEVQATREFLARSWFRQQDRTLGG
jgi:hypothetical protein